MSATSGIDPSFKKTVNSYTIDSRIVIDIFSGTSHLVDSDNNVSTIETADDYKNAYTQIRAERFAAGIADVTNKDIELERDIDQDLVFLTNIPVHDVKDIKSVSMSRLSPREVGQYFAQTALKTTSPDPTDKTNLITDVKNMADSLKTIRTDVDEFMSQYNVFERTIEWVLNEKLINTLNPHYNKTEADRVNNLPYEQRVREIDRMVFRLVRSLTGG